MVRLKHRYLLIEILTPEPTITQTASEVPDSIKFHQPTSDSLTPQLLLRAIRDSVNHLYGDYGNGSVASSLSVRYLSTSTSTAIIRVTRSHYRLVWSALTFITRLPRPVGTTCVMKVARVSGTIRKAEEAAIERARQAVLHARHALNDQYTGGLILQSQEAGQAVLVTTMSNKETDDFGTVVTRASSSESREGDAIED